MKAFLQILVITATAVGYLTTRSCAQENSTMEPYAVFVASTPCNEEVRPLHNIPAEADCDLIKWKLILYRDAKMKSPTRFVLHSEWGYHIDNRTYETRGTNDKVEGKWKIVKGIQANPQAEVYQLNPDQPGLSVSFLKLDDNVIHLMDKHGNLAIGNGGWSFTLNREDPITYPQANLLLPATTPSPVANDAWSKIVFQGRSPCLALADALNVPKDDQCIKIKWLLTLYQDTASFTPTTYELQRTFHRESIIKGKWTVLRGTRANPDAVIYQLDPDKPEQSLLLMKGDDDVFFFLDKDRNLLVGNSDFSYTLNRKLDDI